MLMNMSKNPFCGELNLTKLTNELLRVDHHLTDERRITLVAVPNFEIIVVTISLVGRRFDPKGIPKVDPHEVAEVGGDRSKAGDVGRVILRVHGAVELEGARVPVSEVFAIFFEQQRIDSSLLLSFGRLSASEGEDGDEERR